MLIQFVDIFDGAPVTYARDSGQMPTIPRKGEYLRIDGKGYFVRDVVWELKGQSSNVLLHLAETQAI